MNAEIRLVLYIIGAVLTLCVAGIIALALLRVEIPDVLVAIASSSAGGILGLLVPARKTQ